MLVEYRVANYGPYKHALSLNMKSTKEQRFRNRVPRFQSRYRMSINPIAAIYGPNASGKSTILESLFRLASTIRGNKTTNWQHDYIFALDSTMENEPTLFKLVFMFKEKMYSYFLAIRNGDVLEEYLALLTTDQEILLFDRTVDGIEFGEKWDDDNLLTKIAEKVPNNRTLAGRIADVLSNDEEYDEINSTFFFLRKIIRISPNARQPIIPTFYNDDSSLNSALSALDTGVIGLEFAHLSKEDYPFFEEELKDFSDSTNANIAELRIKNRKLYSIAHDAEGKLEVTHIRFRHHDRQDHEYLLDWYQESQGTRKIIMLLPWLWIAVRSVDPPILLVDELDNSLHTQLAKALIEGFLHGCTNDTRTQLIFTAHDLLLMDLDYLRRDEIWITAKSLDGDSTLIGLPEYRGIRSDKDIRKSYLEGRFGGTPQLDGFALKE